MTDSDLIASFIARKGITKCAQGERTIEEKTFARNRGEWIS